MLKSFICRILTVSFITLWFIPNAGFAQCELQHSTNPKKSYIFSAQFFRSDLNNHQAYPEISICGKEFRINSLRVAAEWQEVKVLVECVEGREKALMGLQLLNRYPGTSFKMRNPHLIEASDFEIDQKVTKLPFFPLGTYGANASNLDEISALGFNSAIVPLHEKSLNKCLALNLTCAVHTPQEPQQLFEALRKNESQLRQKKFFFYVNDEPSLRSVSSLQVEEVKKILNSYYPDYPTMMAVVRPQAIPFYARGADFFMMDQYPVPNMPMSWLADSIDEATTFVGRERVMSVVQAFGSQRHASSGWPRPPTSTEMFNLAISSVIHGSKGIWFFTYPEIIKTERGRKDFISVVTKLSFLLPWFSAPFESSPKVTMVSHYQVTPTGEAAVQCLEKDNGGQKLLLCTNSLRYATRAIVDAGDQIWRDYFSGELASEQQGQLYLLFDELETKVLLSGKKK